MTKILIIFLNTIGIILTPIYSLSMLRQMFYGYKLLIHQTRIFLILVRKNYLFRFLSLYP
ncbi:NAD(P)H-quinone oxidoreductase chain 4 [Arachis hypogaea]|nr:NAD(P)H-quinone oxidoreductase chain 4 [Arachis hypogaea]